MALVAAIANRPRWLGTKRPVTRWMLAASVGWAGLAVIVAVQDRNLWLAPVLAVIGLASIADMAERVIPHRWVMVMVASGVGEMVTGTHLSLPTLLVSAAATVFFLAVYILTRGGLGLGDVKMSLGLGLALGWPLAMTGIVLGLWMGGFYAAYLLLIRRKSANQGIPLGPFLACGALIAALAQ